MKFLHTADWQVGRHHERFGPEDGPVMAEARTPSAVNFLTLSQHFFRGVITDATTIPPRCLIC